MIFTQAAKTLSNEHFEYLVKNCPLNSLQEVLKSLMICYDILGRHEFATKVLLEYHHAKKTLIKCDDGELVLTPLNYAELKKEYKHHYIDFVYDFSKNEAKPHKYEADVYGVTAYAKKDVTEQELQPYVISPSIFDRLAFKKLLKAKYDAKGLQNGFVAKMHSQTALDLVVKVKLVEPKL